MEFRGTSNDKDSKVSRLVRRASTGANKLRLPRRSHVGEANPGAPVVKQDDPICTVTVTCGALNVRSEASQSASRIGGVSQGKSLSVYAVSGDWLKIGYGTGYGWVMAKFTTYEPEVDTSEVGDTGEDYGTLKRPASGDGVMVLQRYLNLYLKKYNGQSFGSSTFQPLKVDGNFGKDTFIHLCYYQYSRNIQGSKGINIDGSCGPKTWKTLRSKAPEVYDITEPKRFASFQYKGPFEGVTILGGGKMQKEAAAMFDDMYNAASKDGYKLKTSNAYRGMTDEESKRGSGDHNSKGQIELWERNEGKPEVCAMPGKSKHQNGVAADFKDMGDQSTAKFKWMDKHAAAYKFKNYEKEAWHWYYWPLA